MWLVWWAKYALDPAPKFPDLKNTAKKNQDIVPTYYMADGTEQLKSLKEFFALPPAGHTIALGALVACTCHPESIAVVIELYDGSNGEGPPMNMAKIYWIRRPKGYNSRIWMHTIARLKEYNPPAI